VELMSKGQALEVQRHARPNPPSNTPECERDEIARALPDGHEAADLFVVVVQVLKPAEN
jgi:hypothetical protein